jgi:hypothetical protein
MRLARNPHVYCPFLLSIVVASFHQFQPNTSGSGTKWTVNGH